MSEATVLIAAMDQHSRCNNTEKPSLNYNSNLQPTSNNWNIPRDSSGLCCANKLHPAHPLQGRQSSWAFLPSFLPWQVTEWAPDLRGRWQQGLQTWGTAAGSVLISPRASQISSFGHSCSGTSFQWHWQRGEREELGQTALELIKVSMPEKRMKTYICQC